MNKFAENLNDWCVLLLRPELLGEADIRFSPVNAATEWGSFVQDGLSGFEALYQNEVVSGSRLLNRTSRQPKYVPTDNQAEVLIRGPVGLALIFEVVVPSESAHKQADLIVRNWPREQAFPVLRVENRMFRPQSYWEAGLFSDILPIEDWD